MEVLEKKHDVKKRGWSVREVINVGRCVEKVKHTQPNCRLTQCWQPI